MSVPVLFESRMVLEFGLKDNWVLHALEFSWERVTLGELKRVLNTL